MTAAGTYESASEARSLALDSTLNSARESALDPAGESGPEAAPESGELSSESSHGGGASPHDSQPEGSLVSEGPFGTEFEHSPVYLVAPEGLTAMGAAASAHGYLWVALERPGPQYRGRLGLYLEESIEQHLEDRGALPPGIHASTGLDASLSDQLYRARLVEMHGIALGIPSLEGITNLGRALDAEDSAVLRWWMAAAADRPVRLVISSENTKLRVYPSPVLFESLFEVAPGPVTPMPPAPAMAESAKTMELSDLPPPVSEETNVHGTEVALRDAGPSAEANFETWSDGESSDDPDEEQGGYTHDVDLPDLDRALGLVADESVPAPPVAPRVRESRSATRNSAQLPLSYESPEPPAYAEHREEPYPLHEGYGPEIHDAETVIPGGAVKAAPKAEARIESELEAGLEDLDADEFLRTLQEDSERVPGVSHQEAAPEQEQEDEASVEGDFEPEQETSEAPVDAAPETDSETESSESGSEAASEPSPLPTKKIARNPFIRLATSDDSERDQRQDKSSEGKEEPGEVASTEAGLSEARSTEPTFAEAIARPHERAPQAEPDKNDPFNQLAERDWKQWVKNLRAAAGPKPLSVIERMFVTDYTRLREAVRRGVADSRAVPVLDEWQASFEKSYSEAFDALRVRGKRPSMVLDLPELAQRLSRLQGAKHTQLLLIDGLRFDLGLMVQDKMRKTVDASLTERLLLWSALPSNTTYQLELLGKGPDGLKERGPVEEDAPALVARGKAARIPRRVRTGSLELLKLDVVEDELRNVGVPVAQRMDEIAEETSAAIVEHLNKQPPRTMVVVFGDHGFRLDASKAGTSEEVRQGGASPEEILVPAFAWLTGARH